MLQLWSALNPGVWVSPSSSELGTFTIPASTQVDQNTRKQNKIFPYTLGYSPGSVTHFQPLLRSGIANLRFGPHPLHGTLRLLAILTPISTI